MTEKSKTGSGNESKSGSTGPSSTKRPQATIDLEAKDVTSEKKSSSTASSKSDSSADKERPKTRPNLKSAKDVETGQKPSDDKREKVGAKVGGGPKSASKSDSNAGFGQAISHFASGVAGGLVALFCAAYGLNWFSTSGPLSEQEQLKFEGRIAAVEKSLSAKGSVDSTLADEVKAVRDDLTAVQTKLVGISKELTFLTTRADTTDTKVEDLAALANGAGSDALRSRLAGLEAGLNSIRKKQAGLSSGEAGVVDLAAVESRFDEKLVALESALTSAIASRAGAGFGQTSVSQLNAVKDSFTLETRRVQRSVDAVREQAGRTETDLGAVKSRTDLLGDDLKVLREEASKLTATISDLKGQVSFLKDKAGELDGLSQSVQPLSGRVSKLEEGLTGVLDRETNSQADAKKTALAVALANLKRAIDRGGAYDDELGVVEMLAPDGLKLAKLKSFSTIGVSPVAKLERGFAKAARSALDADAAPKDDSIVGNLIANARSVVRVRRTGEVPGDSAEAVIARMELRVKEGNLAAALKEGQALSGVAREAADPWLENVAARLEVDEALEQVENQLIAALGGGSSERVEGESK